MWLAILSFLGGPVVKGLIEAYQAKLAAGNVSEKIASEEAGAEIAAQVSETQAQIDLRKAEIGHPFEPEKLAFYIVLVFFAKCIIWDTVLGLGTTPALKGDVSAWAGMVMGFYFARRGFENVARIIKR